MGGSTISTKANKIDALKLQSSTYGATIPVVFGVTRVPCNLLDYFGFKAIKHVAKQRAGKGGGTTMKTVTYTYTAHLILGICEGQILGLPRAWRGKDVFSGGITAGQVVNNTETYAVPGGGGSKTVTNSSTWINTNVVSYTATIDVGDGTTSGPVYLAEGVDYTVAAGVYTFGAQWAGKTVSIEYQYRTGSSTQAGLVKAGFTMFSGAVGQATWSVASSGFTARAIPYSGLAYVAGADYLLTEDASVPNHNFEVQGRLAYSVGSAVDADPAYVTIAMLTDSRYGALFPAAKLNFSLWSKYCRAAGLLISPAFTEQVTAGELVDQIARMTNTAPIWSAGALKMMPYGDTALTGNGATYAPNLTPLYDLDDRHFLPRTGGGEPVAITPRASADAKNWIRVEFLDRTNDYNVAIADAKDQADIDVNGLRPADIVKLHWINDKTVATKVARLLLQRSLYVRNDYTFKLPWTFALLEPMDLVTLTDSYLGLDKFVVRITQITEAEDGDIDVQAEEFPTGIATASAYGAQGGGGHITDFNASPGSVMTPYIFEAPSDRTTTGLEVYAAVTGAGADWGGCNVWVSLDGTGYLNAGTIYGGARYGALTGPISGGSLPVQLNASETLAAASAEDAAALSSLCYIGGASPEYLAHTGATLTGVGAYTLSGLERGAYGTPVVAHTTGDPFVRVDEAVAKSGPLELSMIGKTIYFKFTSFNLFGKNEEDLADVTEYPYTLDGGNAGLSAPVGLTATETTGGIQFTIAPAGGSLAADVVLELYEHSAASPYGAAVLVWSGINTAFLLSKPGPGTWYYWARARKKTAYSEYFPNGDGVKGVAGSSAGGVLKGAAVAGATATGALTGGSYAANINAASYSRGATPVTLRFSSDGYVYGPTSGARLYQWKTGGGVASDYQIRSTITGGTPGTFSTDPSAGTWISLGTTRDWTRNGPAGLTRDVTATFEIRMAASPNTVLDSASIELICDIP